MLKNIFISLCMLLFPAISHSAEPSIVNIPENEFTTYTWIQQAHEQKPFDFIELAANVAHLRANYAQVALKLLQSEDLPLVDRCSLAHSFNAAYAISVKSYANDAPALRKQILANHPRFKLRGLPPLSPDASAEEFGLHNTIFMMSVTLAQWRFLENSIQSFKKHPEKNATAFTNQLLKELVAVANYAVNDCHAAEMSSNLPGITSEKYFADELSYTQCMIDCVMLHANLVLHLDDREITFSRLIKMTLQHYSKNVLGNFFGICLFDTMLAREIDPILSLEVTPASTALAASAAASSVPATSTSAVQVAPMPESVKRDFRKQADEVKMLKSVEFINEDEALNEIMATLLKTNCHLPLLIYDKAQSEFDVTDPFIWKRAKEFYLTNDCLTFRAYLKLFQKEIEEEKRLAERARLGEFLPPDLLRAKAAASAQQKKFVKGGSKSQSGKTVKAKDKMPKGTHEHVEELVVPTSSPSQHVDKSRLEHRAKQQEQMRQQKAKREEEKKKLEEAKSLVMQAKIERAERRAEENDHILSRIKLDFMDDAVHPMMDELDLYELIWAPESKRKHLSWGAFCSKLKSFGWTSYNEDGSSQVFVPPAWFGQVSIHAPDDLKVTLRRQKIMIHQAHDKAATPMPRYCIGFLHEELGNNLGLSALMVQALKLKVASLKSVSGNLMQ